MLDFDFLDFALFRKAGFFPGRETLRSFAARVTEDQLFELGKVKRRRRRHVSRTYRTES